MNIKTTDIKGPIIIEPRILKDARGYFFESFSEKEFCSHVGNIHYRQLFVPRGFAHGFAVLTDEAVFQYKCDNYYAPQAEGAIAWNDPALCIDWKIAADAILLSDKDKCNPTLENAPWLFDYNNDLYK